MEIKRILGTVLKEIREKQNITQARLAEICDLDVDYISKIERGVRQPSLSTLFDMADALNTPMAKIMENVDRMRRSKS